MQNADAEFSSLFHPFSYIDAILRGAWGPYYGVIISTTYFIPTRSLPLWSCHILHVLVWFSLLVPPNVERHVQ